jgi:PTS system N-acetylglucosamine-specific IIC component
VLVDATQVNEQALKALGARGRGRPSARALQVVLGPIADQVASEMRAHLGRAVAATPATLQVPANFGESAAATPDSKAVLAALGGATNVRDVSVCASRLRVTVAKSDRVDERALRSSGARGVVKLRDCIHVVIGPSAASLAKLLQGELAAP